MNATHFPRLFSPLRVKNITLPNRIVMPSMNTNFADLQGFVTPKLINYYEERAKGGAGLIMLSSAYIDPTARKRRGGIALYDDRFIPGLQSLTQALKKWGCAVFQQLNHNGRLLASTSDLKTHAEDRHVVAPSPVPHPLSGKCPRELKVAEIEELIEKFAQGAIRAKQAGFDGVELHGAHGYLIGQFFSAYTNRREDDYGGTLEKRMRFPLEILRQVRGRVGEDFAISYRMSAVEFREGGVKIEESRALAQALEKNGADLIHVTGGINETPESMLFTIPMGSVPQDLLYPLARPIKEAVSLPVIAVGRINRPELAEEILQSGGADLVTTGRALICDPYWPQKARQGRTGEIRKCIACNQGCLERISQEEEQTCLLNPGVGREGLGDLDPARVKKKVLVVGGGPAGMEAAVVAALRGHDVELFEKEKELGGQLDLAARPPGKEEFSSARKYLEAELERLKVPVHLNQELTVEAILEKKPGAVIVATGALPLREVSGAHGDSVVAAWDVLRGKEVGKKVVIAGGGLVGIETALFLVRQGKEITVIEKLEEIGRDAGFINRARLRKELLETKIEVRCNTELVTIHEKSLAVRDPVKEYELPMDTVVLALGAKAQNSLSHSLQGKIPQLFAVGDCLSPRKMLEAISEGYLAAVQIGER